MLQAGWSPIRVPIQSLNFLKFYLILPAALGRGVHSDFNGNEYQIMFLESRARQVRRTDNVGS
jgi:hypothetical protein